MRQLLKTELTDFGLSVRALNCLKTAEVFTLGELVSFGVFYKNFTNPIEFVFNTQAQNDELTWRNVENGKLYGVEVEIKKQLNCIFVKNG